MRRSYTRLAVIAIAVIVVLLAITAVVNAQESAPAPAPSPTPTATPAPKPKPLARWQKNGCDSYVKVSTYRKSLKRKMRYRIVNGDFRAHRYRSKNSRKLGELRECARTNKTRKSMLKIHHRRKKQWRWVAYIDRITPYGKWAIPPYIVMCESGGAWSAYNPSGASGPYQLLGWGAPMPANTTARQATHHRIAARLWAGGRGASHWVCA